MSREVIGWIEIDESASDIGAALTAVPRQFGSWTRNRGLRMTPDPVHPAEFTETEFVAVDARQLQADLEAEFAQLLGRTRAK